MAARPRAGSGAASMSRPFLPSPFFHTNSELPSTLCSFSRFGESGNGERRDRGREPGLPRPAGSDATVAVATRWNGRWVQVPALPRPGCGTDSLGERLKRLPRVWRPWGRTLESEPIALAWGPPLYQTHFPIPLPNWAVSSQSAPTLGTMFADLDYDIEEDKLGIPTVPGKVTLQKDAQNLIGISIGGGAQYCPCLYIVQVFDNTPAALDGTVAAGDEITGVNGRSIKGKTKVEVAKMIQEVKGEVTIHYNKLQADPKQGMSLDIVLKKVKHRLVENMSSGTADALGLSRAILCNDGLVKRLEELERTAELYKGMTEHTKNLLRAFYELSQTHRAFGDVFSVIGVREPQPAASEAFVKFADAHRSIEKFGIRLLKTIKPMLTDLNTYLNKAIPDTRLTIKKYLDVKFEYLSYCLKVKEMDDEEYSCIALGEPLYRVSTGNYEYRLILRCRQEARARFSQMRKDVLEKMELLDQKHVQDIVFQLQRFVSTMSKYYNDCYAVLRDADVFPIEVDLAHTTLAYGPNQGSFTDGEEEEEEEEDGAAKDVSKDARGATGPMDKSGSWCDS
ncbi:PRKCA-binding protein [Sigmodon hispidus]